MGVLVDLPAEAVAPQSQLQGVGLPGVVGLVLQGGAVPRDAAGAAPSDGGGPSVGQAGAQRALLVLICRRTQSTRRYGGQLRPSPSGQRRENFTLRTLGHGAELPDDLRSFVDETPRGAVVVRVPEAGRRNGEKKTLKPAVRMTADAV